MLLTLTLILSTYLPHDSWMNVTFGKAHDSWLRTGLEVSSVVPPPVVSSRPVVSVPWVGSPGVEQWRSLVAAYFSTDQVDTALRVMQCESKGNPTAQHPTSYASGLFQFIPSTWKNMVMPALGYTVEDVWNPEKNIAAAAWLQRVEGWASQWSCY